MENLPPLGPSSWETTYLPNTTKAANPGMDHPQQQQQQQQAVHHHQAAQAHHQHQAHQAALSREYEQALMQDDTSALDPKMAFKASQLNNLFVCECGKQIVNANEYNIARHKASKRHAEALSNSDSEFFMCECGKRLLRSQKDNEDNMAQHRASRKHIQAMAKKQKMTDLGFTVRTDDTNWATTLQSLRTHVVSLELIREAEDELMRGLSALEQEYQRTASLLTTLEKAQSRMQVRAEKLALENASMKASVVSILQAREQEVKILKHIAESPSTTN
ncbi:hypothetical protein, variant [Saprolegnia diclina VS20]|uniref:Uncharacterized protein n=1 Tax=Saprolegnia diclina (strain VS20) TaxID=1156394 RepID=T0SFQ9_SAPDV|nr:hypothetical protein, variant [Saprolegnia diclina VS20]XP_008604421.1 hypothetical protein SDRG_00708 [Saprolegnia diclina VS20]EQC41851.1 hypothetical protein SDRG_00708 [Saprolegnia diclina VS20]EQC41852.1 hypothetical protein, variant [Saprolegnia diclina VS20]|eukprot:XP_008604420.1 hypothetical protein, variant [Saprolegnia diclina VS20]